MDYYIILNGQQSGPFPENELLAHGVTPSTPVWCERLAYWKDAGEVAELAYLFRQTYQTPAYPPHFSNQAHHAYAPIPPMPKTWLAESIIVTLFCCLPFGIIGIFKASNVTSLYAANKFIEAQKASKQARLWTLIGFFSFFSYIIFSAIFYFIFFVTAHSNSLF